MSGAAGQSYMSLAGELVGAVESLRMLRDICAEVAPASAAQNTRAYEEWAARNSDLLTRVKTQRDRMDERLPKSTAEVVALLQSRLSAQLRAASADSQRRLCARYPQLITSSEKDRAGEISALLKVVTEADEVLSLREAQN